MYFKADKNKNYIKNCETIIKQNGSCYGFSCEDCPIIIWSEGGKYCKDGNGYNKYDSHLEGAKEYLKLIKGENDMTKNDLKDGMIVELRNRGKRLVLNNNLLNHDYYINLELYKDDLRFTSSSYDVMKVYTSESSCLNNILNVKHYNLIWERKEKSEAEIKLDNIEKQIEELQKSAKELREEINK